ncbi:MAG: efflux RND transporter periplasmic adaptor subunit [Gammaproteobacteria bacterium]|nr:efflux RND transporter periplasmic adaptor subunit [Gammaproteobacteria bacterium]MDE2346260.1 efflux RND transporter periplasmic adaptor subunit [Gammaproteobacteria bacterium]
MRQKRKLWITLAIVAGIILLVVVSRLVRGGDTQKVTIAKVETRTIRSSILASGQLIYINPVELKPEVIGKISQIPVVEGQMVKAGQVVLRLDPELYAAAVDQAKAGVQQAQLAIDTQKLTISNLQLQYNRQHALYKQHLVDANTFDQLANQLAIAKVQLDSQVESLRIAQAQLSQAQQNLSKTVILSPINGMVTNLPVKVGETVITGTNIPGSTLMEIADPSEVQADVQVDEADIANVKLNEEANINAVSYPNDTFHGKVQFIAASVTDNSTSTTTQAAQQGVTFEVKIGLTDQKLPRVRPGMSCRAEIFTQSTPNAIAVPLQAVLYENNPNSKSLEPTTGAYVYVMRGGKAYKIDVTTGVSSDTYQEVLSGLKAGDTVITGPYTTLHALSDGASISVLPDEQHKSAKSST